MELCLWCFHVLPFCPPPQDCGLQLNDEEGHRCYPLESHLLCHGCHIHRLQSKVPAHPPPSYPLHVTELWRTKPSTPSKIWDTKCRKATKRQTEVLLTPLPSAGQPGWGPVLRSSSATSHWGERVPALFLHLHPPLSPSSAWPWNPLAQRPHADVTPSDLFPSCPPPLPLLALRSDWSGLGNAVWANAAVDCDGRCSDILVLAGPGRQCLWSSSNRILLQAMQATPSVTTQSCAN